MAIEYAEDGVTPKAWWAHIEPMLTMEPAASREITPARDGLGKEEEGAVEGS